jgi:hypothetical protein
MLRNRLLYLRLSSLRFTLYTTDARSLVSSSDSPLASRYQVLSLGVDGGRVAVWRIGPQQTRSNTPFAGHDLSPQHHANGTAPPAG